MPIWDDLEGIIKTLKHLLWNATGEIAQETFDEISKKASEKTKPKKGGIRRHGFANIVSVFITVGGIVLLGVINSPETTRLAIEYFNGPEAAATFEHQEKVGNYIFDQMFIVFLYCWLLFECMLDLGKNLSKGDRFGIVCLIIIAAMVAIGLSRGLYNYFWGSRDSAYGDLLASVTLLLLFFLLLLVAWIIEHRLGSKKLPGQLVLVTFFLAGLVYFVGMNAFHYVARGDF